jgi:hypothetical protein
MDSALSPGGAGCRRNRLSDRTVGLRVSAADEAAGLDLSEHDDVGYQQATPAAPVTITSVIRGPSAPQVTEAE